MNIKIWFETPPRLLISGSVMIVLVMSVNKMGIEIELILGGRSFMYNRKRDHLHSEPCGTPY
jgi:hypothetical protein